MITSAHLYTTLLGSAGVLLTAAGYLLLKTRKTPEDRERERRQRISSTGRITDGFVVDAHEIVANGRTGSQFLVYRYDVAGVSYEASQDVTYLRHYVDLHTCKHGLPTSVRYDAQNPGDSIVISETWIGLRH